MAVQKITRIYDRFRGADLRREEGELTRSPECLNMWKNYRQAGCICTRPAMELLQTCDRPVWGIFFYNGTMLVHAGSSLYKAESGQLQLLYSGLQSRVSRGFVYENVWYFLDGGVYLCYDGQTVKPVKGYVPTTSVARSPAGGGTRHEDVNMLTGRRINTFAADGMSFDFYLDAENIDPDFPPIVKINGALAGGYTVDYAAGKIAFTLAPDAPLTDGQDNVAVEFSKTVPGCRESILGCTLVQLFDNRVFFSGNAQYPNVLWHCALNDPTYVSDLDYYREGMDSANIRGLAAGNNALWVFREPSDANTTVFYHTPVLDDEYGKIYPSSHSSVTTGCVGSAVNFGDDIVFFSRRGMEGISGDITTEQVLSHRSSLVDCAMTREAGYADMLLEEWEGYLLVCIRDRIYLADSRSSFSHQGHREYEWFYWQMEQPITCTRVQEGVLYLGTETGIYTLTGSGPVQSCWVTPRDSFQLPNRQKSTARRGFAVEGTGDITLLSRQDAEEYRQIGSYANVTDHFVARLREKKFKDLQLKFQSQTRFSLEKVTLECYAGNYIKR